MRAYPDTSFLCALYRSQINSPDAAAHFKSMKEPLHVTSLLLYEFRQSLRFQVWRHTHDPKTGFPEAECDKALADLESDLGSGAVVIAAADWAAVHHTAEQLSAAHTKTEGHRALDTLHVATALHLEAKEFLTFDERQRKLASAKGLAVEP